VVKDKARETWGLTMRAIVVH
jgi:hypothetical protein